MNEPYQETIRDVLIYSFYDEQPDRFLGAPPEKTASMSVIPVKSETIDFSDYLIRTSALYNHDFHGVLNNYMEFGGSGLAASKPQFIGPKTSQSLMTLVYEGNPLKVEEYFPLMEIVPKHEGKTLEKFLNEPAEPGVQSAKVAQYFVDNPQALTYLFEQAAFIGLQSKNRVLPMADLHSSNFMVDANDAGEITDISLIDLVSSEEPKANRHHYAFAANRPYESDPDLNVQQKQAMRYIDPERQYSLYEALSRFARGDQKEAFTKLLKNTHAQTIEKITQGTLEESRPDWKGFDGRKRRSESVAKFVNQECEKRGDDAAFHEVNGVMAISLRAPAYALKLALDKLYDQAAPDREAAR